MGGIARWVGRSDKGRGREKNKKEKNGLVEEVLLSPLTNNYMYVSSVSQTSKANI